ncbi:hypothetical protein XK24_00900 [Streptococcus suis]|nr:hypothetical protein XK24_00900 [Streptococcus suis]
MIYLKDGNIPLNLAYDDDIVQEANSTYQLSFKFPLTDGKWNLLRREVFLLADDLHGEQERNGCMDTVISTFQRCGPSGT